MMIESVFIALNIKNIKNLSLLQCFLVFSVDFLFSIGLYNYFNSEFTYYFVLVTSVFLCLIAFQKANFVDLIYIVLLNFYMLFLNLITIPIYKEDITLAFHLYVLLLLYSIATDDTKYSIFKSRNIYDYFYNHWGQLDTRNVSIVIICSWFMASIKLIERVF